MRGGEKQAAVCSMDGGLSEVRLSNSRLITVQHMGLLTERQPLAEFRPVQKPELSIGWLKTRNTEHGIRI